MKKTVLWILVLTMVFSLVGCGSGTEGSSAQETSAETQGSTQAAEQTKEPESEAEAEQTKAAPETSAAETEPVESEPAETEPEQIANLPAVGETVNGFRVLEIREFPLMGASLVWFEHEKTGAKLMYIANDDTNRVFDLTFFTRAIDNTGLPHVFEHSTLDGSDRYPSKSLFFNLSYQTYNTYMNAVTMPPPASTSSPAPQ